MLRRWIWAWALTALVALGISGVASAHAILVRTDPVDGAVLASAPRQIHLWFSEAVVFKLTTLELVDSNSQRRSVTNVRPGESLAELVADLPELPASAYRLTWKTVSSDDLHTSRGSIVFGVQQAVGLAAPVEATPPPSPIEVLLRWLNFGALSGLVGACAVAFLLLPLALGTSQAQSDDQLLASAHRLRRRLLGLALGADLLALAAGVGLLLTQVAAAGDIRLDSLQQVITQTSYGTYGLMRAGWLIALAIVIVLRLRDRVEGLGQAARPSFETDRLTLLAILPLVLAIATMQALTGHAAAFNGASVIRIGADVLHLLGASVWAGGLLAMAITLAPLLRRGPAEKMLARSILQRFGVLAAASLAVLFVTGLYSSGQQVASLDALLTTAYGQSLLLKTGLALSVGVIGLINSSLLHPRVADVIRRILRRPAGWALLDRQHVSRTVLIESLGATTILLLAALLSASQPARGPEFDPPATSQEATAPSALTMPVDDLVLTLSIKPDRPGQNFISLGVFNTRRPAPAPIERVIVRLTPPAGPRGKPPIELEAVQQNDGIYQVTGSSLDTAGDWQIAVNVKRSGLADAAFALRWTVLPALQVSVARPVLVSNQPLAPLLTLAAGLLALSLIGIAGGIWLIRRIRRTALVQRIEATRHLRLLSRG